MATSCHTVTAKICRHMQGLRPTPVYSYCIIGAVDHLYCRVHAGEQAFSSSKGCECVQVSPASPTEVAVQEVAVHTEGLVFSRGGPGAWDCAAVGNPVVSQLTGPTNCSA